MTYSVTTLSDVSELSQVSKTWSEFLAADPNPHLPLSLPWATAWWAAFGNGKQLAVKLVYEGDSVIAIVPMCIKSVRERGIDLVMQTSIANGASPFTDVLFRPQLSDADRERAILALIEDCDADVLEFKDLLSTGRTKAEIVNASRQVGRHVGCEPGLNTPVIRTTGEWQVFFGGKSKKFRKSMRGKLNKFDRAGFVTTHHVLGCDDNDLFDDIVRVSSKSWKRDIGKDLKTDERSRNFVRRMISEVSGIGAVEAWIARDGETPIAYELHFVYDGVAYPIRADFDRSYPQTSPGSVVEYRALEATFEDESKSLYYTCANNYAYLDHWTDEFQVREHVRVFGRSAKALLLHAIDFRLRPVVRSVRSRWQSG